MGNLQRTWNGKISDCGMVEKEGKSARVYVQFECASGDGEVTKKTWWGTLKEGKALDFCLKTLLGMGFTSDWDALASGSDLSKIFTNVDKEFELVVEDEVYNGKTYEKVKYVNDPDAPRGTAKMAPAQAVNVVRSMNLKALTLQKKAEMGQHMLPTEKKQSNGPAISPEIELF